MTPPAEGEETRYAREIVPGGRDSLSKIAALIAPGSAVLDVGAGPGALGKYLSSQKGCRVDGIEVDPALAAQAQPWYRKLISADLESASLERLLPAGEYDVIVCADVLEHLRNPAEVLCRLKPALRSGGRFVISIPNVGYAGVIAGLLEGEFAYTPEGLLDNTHVRFFTRNSLLRMLEDQGLHALTVDFVTHTVDESEFRGHRIELLPPAVRSALLAGPDALTYQFIVQAAPVQAEKVVVAPLARPKLLFTVELYWQIEGKPYSDASRVSAAGEIGLDRQEVRLALPKFATPPSAFRLDPSDRPGFLRVRSISLRDREGEDLWRWEGEDLTLAQTFSQDLVEFSAGGDRWWMAIGDDAHLALPVPASAMGRASEGTLSLEMGWPIAVDTFAAERVVSEAIGRSNAVDEQLRVAAARVELLAQATAQQARALTAQANALAEQGTLLAAEQRRAQALEARVAAAEGLLAAAAARIEDLTRELHSRLRTLEDLQAGQLGDKPVLHPRRFVHPSPDPAWQWEASGGAAQFFVGRKVERGWYRIAWRGRSEVPLSLKLSIDYGHGFDSGPAFVFGALGPQPAVGAQYIPFDKPAHAMRLDVGERPARFDLQWTGWTSMPGPIVQGVALANVLRAKGAARELLGAVKKGRAEGLATWRELRRRALYDKSSPKPPPEDPGLATAREAAAMLDAARADATAAIVSFAWRPTVSVLVPCYDTDPKWLAEAVQSVRDQFYPHWELVLVDDGSPSERTRDALKQLDGVDPKIRVLFRKKNGGIAAATNDALQAARGELVAMLDHDDTLTPDALFEVVRRFDESPDLDAVYTDQDKIDETGRRYEPFYKPDWSPELFRGVMYVGHLLVVRRSLALSAGGFDSRFDKVQDFEFMLRIAERTSRIGHVAKVLYHWRAIQGSVARGPGEKSGITELQAAAVNAHLARLGIRASAEPHPDLEHRVVIQPRAGRELPLVSIVIPTRDAPHHISRCLDSIFARTTYPKFEVVVVDNGTTDAQALAAIRKHPVVVVPFNEKFNFSRANNLGAAQAKGEILVLLNNDTEVIDPDWIEKLVFHLQLDGVGMVGPMLLYPDNSVQHAGVVLGFRGTADHVMRGFPAGSDGYAGSLSCTREVSGVTAACLAIRRADYFALGGLVDHYCTHYQDVDLCLRVRESGKRILFVPRARLHHHESASRGGSYDHLDRALLLDTWGEVIARGDPYYNPNFTLERHDYSLRPEASP